MVLWEDGSPTPLAGDGMCGFVLYAETKKRSLTNLYSRSFLGQGPIFLVAIGLSYWLLPVVTVPASRFDEEGTQSRLGRIDSLGALLLGSGILSLMLPLEVGGQKISWSHPLIFILLGLGVALLVVFALVEAYQAKEPILPLRLLRQRNVALSFAIMASQAAAQLAVS